MGVFFLIIFIIGVPLLIRLLAGSQDQDRIRDYLKNQGAILTSCEWAPFSRGWYGSEKERLYAITYVDSRGDTHNATCKTNMFAGVYFTEDTIVSTSREQTDPRFDRETPEVERLRNEVADLKRRLNERDSS